MTLADRIVGWLCITVGFGVALLGVIAPGWGWLWVLAGACVVGAGVITLRISAAAEDPEDEQAWLSPPDGWLVECRFPFTDADLWESDPLPVFEIVDTLKDHGLRVYYAAWVADPTKSGGDAMVWVRMPAANKALAQRLVCRSLRTTDWVPDRVGVVDRLPDGRSVPHEPSHVQLFYQPEGNER